MLWREENNSAVKTQAIVVVLDLFVPLIPNVGGLPVAQLFSQKIVVSPLDIPFVLAALVFTYLTTKRFLLMLLYLYISNMCLPVHKLLFS